MKKSQNRAAHVICTAVLGSGATPLALAADAGNEGIEEVIITAQKRAQSIQDVPIAVSALSSSELENRGIAGSRDLQYAVPNMSFARAQFGQSNYQIRGIGYQLVTTAGDAGVGVHENNSPLAVNRIADADFYDMERVEVLRGPQGTLFGRNATGGVINFITAKPQNAFDANLALEYGTENSRRFTGFVNLPLGGVLAVRAAGTMLKRNGYSTNAITGDDVDGRDLWSTRITVDFTPTGAFTSFLMWEHFRENDDRTFNQKTVCLKDTGPTSIGGVPVSSADAREFLSQGCTPSSVYDSATRTGSVNTAGTLNGVLAKLVGIQPIDGNANKVQSADLRTLELLEPTIYQGRNDLGMLNIEWEFREGLKVTSLTAFSQDDLDQRSDAENVAPSVPFATTPFTPGGVLAHAQVGSSNVIRTTNINDLTTRQWTQELRLQSAFDGPMNFNVGGMWLKLDRVNDVFVVGNAEKAYAQCFNLGPCNTPPNTVPAVPIYIDPNPVPDGLGHDYFISHNPYQLRGRAAFGELYWQALETLRVTAGLRYTDDEKTQVLYPVTLLAPGQGWSPTGPLAPVPQLVNFTETTGRLNFDYKLAEDSMVYASYSKGYKGGGFNTPNVTTTSPSYKPEFVNAYEIGSKNRFADGRVMLNATAFYYDYQDYQVSQVRGFSGTTENVDAKVAGAELEATWEPVRRLRFNATLGFLDTEIKEGESIDEFDRTRGNTAFTYARGTTAACVVPTTAMATFIGLMNAGTPVIPVAGGAPRAITPRDILGICAGSFTALGLTPTGGVNASLVGNELPNSPRMTAGVGAQYIWNAGDWTLTARGDYFRQARTFATNFNRDSDQIASWDNVNVSFGFERPSVGLKLQVYARNLFDEEAISTFSLNSGLLGLTRTVFLVEPRLVGIVASKSFGAN
ncbi:MAG: TonB-dependent receptor [Steroidobacteraceae bacterium]